MHLHQPDWKSGVRAVDGCVDAGDYTQRPDAADGRRSCTDEHYF